MSNNVLFNIIGILLLGIAGLGVLSMLGKDMSAVISGATSEEVSSLSEVDAVSTTVSEATTEPAPEPVQSPRTFTMAQIATHNSESSCYTVVSGSVYDLTPFVGKHPGGMGRILSICGKDGSAAFSDQHEEDRRPANELAKLKIGTLVQ